MKFDMYFKNIENMQFNGQIFKICNNVNLFNENCSIRLQPTTKFVTKLCPYTLVPLTIYYVFTNKKKSPRKILFN